MKKSTLLAICATVFLFFGSSGTMWALSAGDIAIIAVNADATKSFAFVALADIPANTNISFTDNAWNASTQAWRTGEGTISWSHTSIITKGTVIILTVDANPYLASVGTVTYNSNFNLSTSGDQILAYEGTTAPTTNTSNLWLYGFSLENWAYANNTNQSDIPTALSSAGAYVGMTTSTTEVDNAYFANGSTAQTAVSVSGTKAELLVLFNDASKYYKNDTGPLTLPAYTITVNTGATAPTVTTQAVTAIAATSATGNGNITNTGGSNATVRGFCYDVYANPDPDLSDSYTTENGDFGTGAFTGSITSLSAETRYKVVAYATNPTGTGYGSAVNFWTLSTEPSSHSTTFSNSVISQTEIDLSFDAASTISNADGYLILRKVGSAPTGVPADATAYSAGNTIGDGTVAAVITNTSATTAQITGLTANTHYYFTIIPFNWNGTDAATYNYKTDGTIPGTDGTTLAPLDATSEVSGPALSSQPDPVLISSLVTTDAAAVQVFDMDIYDYGTDGQPTKITQVTIKAGSNNTANWANVIQGVKLSTDAGSTFVTIGTPTINAASIVIPITSGNLNIPDEDALTLSFFIYLKSAGLTDNQVLEFKVDAAASSHGWLADATGSTFLATFSSAPVSNQMLIDVEATKLKFVQQPSNTLLNAVMSPAVTVEATDANNNRDLDKSGTVGLISSGTMTGPVTASMASGFGTFGNIVHTVAGSSLTLTASLSGLTDATSNTFSIFSALVAGDILFIAYGTDDPDKFAFLATEAIPEGTQIVFTDNAWTGSALATNEGSATWTAPTGGLAKGAVVTIQGTTVTGGGSVTTNSMAFSTSGDQILAYQGSSSSPSFIAGVSSSGWITSGSTTSNTSYLPGALTQFINATGFSSEEDNGYYNGPLTLATGAAGAFICNEANWLRSATIQTLPGWSFSLGNSTVINVASAVQNLTINPGESLTINSDKSLTVNGTLTNDAGAANLIVRSDASLIENSGAAATVECEIASGEWHLISSPVSDAYSEIFSDEFLQYHSEGSNTYTYITSTSYLLTPGMGFALFGGDGFTASYAGTLNTGTQGYGTSMSGLGWNLVGNPYPSYIDWDAATGWTLTNINDATYRHVTYDETGPYYGWATYVNGVGANGGTRYIAPCQGFFVRASNATSAFSMTNNVRTHNQSTFFKSSNEIVPNMVRLQVAGNGFIDEAVVRLKPEATASFDGNFDAYKLYGDSEKAPQIYISDSEPLIISSIPEPVPVNVGLKAGSSGTYTISATEINDLTNVKLEDTKTGIITSLAEKSYTFDWEAGENENRFILRFAAVGTPDPEKEISSIYSYDKTAIVDLPANVRSQVYIYNLAGQPVAVRESATGQVRIGLSPTGVYVVKVVTARETLTKKVWIR